MKYSAQSGQALLIVLLVMAVVLTIALSIVSRSVTDVTVTQKEEEAARAYSAAEAGIEKTLLSGTAHASQSLPSGDTFSTSISSLSSASREYIVPLLMASGETTPVWFVQHDATNQLICSAGSPCFTGTGLMICWGNTGTSSSQATTPAIEMSLVYTTSNTDLSTARVARITQDPYIARPDANSFTKGSDGPCTLDGKTFAFSKRIDNLSTLGITLRPEPGDQRLGPQIARLRLIYNTDQAHQVGLSVLSAQGSFPKQGSKVEATGVAGGASRKIEVYQLYPDLPPIFDYGLFSGTGGITK